MGAAQSYLLRAGLVIGLMLGHKTRKAEADCDMVLAQKMQCHCLAEDRRLQLIPHAGCPGMDVVNRLL